MRFHGYRWTGDGWEWFADAETLTVLEALAKFARVGEWAWTAW